MYTKIESKNKQLATSAFEQANTNQTMNPIFEYFATVAQQYPDGYQQDMIPVAINQSSTQTNPAAQSNTTLQALDLVIHALKAGNDRFYPFITFLLDDSSLYKEQEEALKQQIEENHSLWCDIKWAWAVASAIKVIMEDVKDLLKPHRKLYVMPNMQEKHTYRECFAFFTDVQCLYYINEEGVLSFIKNELLDFNQFEPDGHSVFKLSAKVVTTILQDDTPDDFNLLEWFDNDSIELYYTTLLNRLNKLKPYLDKNFNYLMDQVLTGEKEELRKQLHIKFSEKIRQYMPETIEEIEQSIFNLNNQNNTEALLTRIQQHIDHYSQAENGGQVAFSIQQTSYIDGMQNLADRKRSNKTTAATLLLNEKQDGITGYQIPCEYRPLITHQRHALARSPHQPIKAGIPSTHTPLTLQQLIELSGKVSYDAIDTKTGNHLYLLALLYRNTQVCEFLKLKAPVLYLEEKNLNQITATMYEQADFSTVYRYTTPPELVRSAREKVLSYDAVGELLRKFDSELRTYKEKWMMRQAKIKKREASDDFHDKAYDALVSFFGMKRSFECRGAEVEFYIALVEEAFKDPFTSELYNKAKESLKNNAQPFDVFNTELPSQVKSVLKTIDSNHKKYSPLRPIDSDFVQGYKKLQTRNEADTATIGRLEERLKSSEENTAKAITDVMEKCAIQIAENNERHARKMAENDERHARNIAKLEQKIEMFNRFMEQQMRHQSESPHSERVSSYETKSNQPPGGPGFFG